MDEDNSRRKYHGWTNYETWVVRLWLDNEEPSYRYWTEQARRLHRRDGAARHLAEQLKEELSEASPVNEPTVYGDLMNAALEEVNWLEIAETYLEEMEPEKMEPEEAVEAGRLAVEDIERLPREEFDAPPEGEGRTGSETPRGARPAADPAMGTFVRALDDFAEAAASLDRAWMEAADSADAAADGYPFRDAFEVVVYDIQVWSRTAIERLTPRPERAEDEGREGSEAATSGGSGRLTLEDIERLPGDEFRALPEDDRRRFFDHMDRENFPTPEEFYGYEAEREQPGRWPEGDEEWTDGGESCDGPARPEPTTQRKPMEPAPKKVRMTLEGLDGNAFVLLTAFARQAKRQGWTRAEVDAVLDEARSGDYDHLLRTLFAHTEEPTDD